MERAFFGGVIACAISCSVASGSGDDLLRLWGIDNDDAQLFAIDDVRNPGATMVDYGAIHVADGLDTSPVEGGIHAFTIVNTFDAFFVASEGVGSVAGPVLLHIDLHDLDTSGEAGDTDPGVVTAEVVGSLLDAGWDPRWTITGIAGDPLYNEMYILGADDLEVGAGGQAVVGGARTTRHPPYLRKNRDIWRAQTAPPTA